MAQAIDATRMAAILAAYGADPARWPADERESARAWMAVHGDDLATALADAGALDAVLARDTRGDAPNEALKARVLQGVPGAGETVVPFRTPVRSWNAGAIAALAACAVIGVVIGFNASNYSAESIADADAALGVAFGVEAERGVLGSDG